MPTWTAKPIHGRPLLDIASFARQGPGRRDHLAPTDIELIQLTATRTSEVMVKVLTRGGQGLKAVQGHLAYLNRKGELELETDDGQSISGKSAEARMLEEWDLDIETDRRQANLAPTNHRQPPKLIHKILFSMPPGTQPDKVLQAVRNLAREQFSLQHRYALALHTDEPHPHVHVVVKAVSEQGIRLNIRKATLREWRMKFAWHLRDLGVPANATERAVRGESRTRHRDGIYRAAQRGASTHVRELLESVVSEIVAGKFRAESGRAQITSTRREVERGWHAIVARLSNEGWGELAAIANEFVGSMSRPLTDRERIARGLVQGARKARESRAPLTR